MEKGKLIVFEGLNGCGKGTHILPIADLILNKNRANTIFLTREPNEFDENGMLARKMLFSDGDPYQNNLEAVRYFAKNRVTHNKIFNPMLDQGIHVISDRYWESNFAFQHAQGISYTQIAEANISSRKPDLTYIIDAPVEVIFERLNIRDGNNRRKFDSNFEFMKKVRDNYLELKEVLPKVIGDYKIVYINGDHPIKNIQQEIRQHLKEKLGI